jgi:hypothetical protein
MVTPRIHRLAIAASVAAAVVIAPIAPVGPVRAEGGAVHAAAPQPLTVTSPATGGEAIPSSTARFDGTGAWTDIRGLVLTETTPGAVAIGGYVRLALPLNFEFDPAVTAAPAVTGCDKKASNISYPASRVASTQISLKFGAMVHGPCRIAFGTLRIRPVSGASLVKRGGASVTVYESGAATLITTSAAQIAMHVPSWTWPTLTRAAGGDAIPRTTAGIGGSGAWTTLTGLAISETMAAQINPGITFRLTIPVGFEWDQVVTTPPSVTGCDRMASPLAYDGHVVAFTILTLPMPDAVGICRIDLGSTLRLRPVDAAATEGVEGPLALSYDAPGMPDRVPFPGLAGWIAMVTPPPPAVPIALSVASPHLHNGAIDWGRYVDLTTTAPPDTTFTLQVTVTDPAGGAAAWETLRDAAGTILKLRTAADGRYTYRYTPVRNYWYRAVTETSQSETPRVTVRQTIVVRPVHTGTRRVAAGTSVTFTATVRPVRPELAKANVRFELYRRSGSAWVLARSATVVIDDAGVASYPFTFAYGRWYVRAQAQPTQVNANSFWTPSQSYSAR